MKFAPFSIPILSILISHLRGTIDLYTTSRMNSEGGLLGNTPLTQTASVLRGVTLLSIALG